MEYGAGKMAGMSPPTQRTLKGIAGLLMLLLSLQSFGCKDEAPTESATPPEPPAPVSGHVLPEAELILDATPEPKKETSPEKKEVTESGGLALGSWKEGEGQPQWNAAELLPSDSRKLNQKITLGEGSPADNPLRYARQDRRENTSAAVSMGTVTLGRLVRGKAIPISGVGYRLMERTINRGTYFGGDALVGAVERAAKAVDKQKPGSMLQVGNASLEKGGDISQSASHNSGRDIDLAFYMTDVSGMPVYSSKYVKFGPDGKTEPGDPRNLRFDVARNWLLVDAFLRDREVQVQYIFIADWLKDILLAHAISVSRANDDPLASEIIRRAEIVMRQPNNSSPHAEHFHIRLYCELHERLLGCQDFGAKHAHTDGFSEDVQARIDELLELYSSGIPEERQYALSQLDLLTAEPEDQEESEAVDEP